MMRIGITQVGGSQLTAWTLVDAARFVGDTIDSPVLMRSDGKPDVVD